MHVHLHSVRAGRAEIWAVAMVLEFFQGGGDDTVRIEWHVRVSSMNLRQSSGMKFTLATCMQCEGREFRKPDLHLRCDFVSLPNAQTHP